MLGEKSYFERTGKLGPKIDLYLVDPRGMHFWKYQYSTRWHRTCRDAKAHLCASLGYRPDEVRARIDRR
jgi:hypothetical protein